MQISLSRILLVAFAIVAVSLLLNWQQSRERLISRCVAEGGQWDGRNSNCAAPLQGPIILRDLRRT